VGFIIRKPGPVAHGRRRAAHGRTRRRGATRSAQIVLLVLPLKYNCSKNLYKSRPSDEYQSCRSSYQQHFLQRLYRVFLPRFDNIWMPTLNVSLIWQTVFSALHLVFQVFPLKIWNATLHESCVPHQDLQLS
jgi:hypothetical protein